MKTSSLILSLLVVASIVEFAAAQVNVHFTNPTRDTATVEWLNGNDRTTYLTLAPGETRTLQSYVGHRWSISSRIAATASTVTQAEQVISLGGPAPAPAPAVPDYRSNRPNYNQPGFEQPIFEQRPQISSLNQSVVNYAQSVVGQRIGNGQCTELAIAALRAAGAQPGQNYVWGTTLRGVEDLQPGDIIQMFDARFQNPNGSSGWSTGPHTAIVTSVEGTKVGVLHQNVAGSPVQTGEYDFRYATGGRFNYYRPAAGRQDNGFGGQFGGNGGQFNGGQFGGGQFGGNSNQPRNYRNNDWQQGLQPIPRYNTQPLERVINYLFE